MVDGSEQWEPYEGKKYEVAQKGLGCEAKYQNWTESQIREIVSAATAAAIVVSNTVSDTKELTMG